MFKCIVIVFLATFVFSFAYGQKAAIDSLAQFSEAATSVAANILKNKKHKYANTSLLASGMWLKIKLSKNGIYRISYNELKKNGIENPEQARLFGWGGGMLPEMNNVENYDDLVENNISHVADGIVFYALGSVEWKYNESNKSFNHTEHPYSDYAYYFITSNLGTPQSNQVGELVLVEGNADRQLDSFLDFAYFENNSENILSSGRRWFGGEIGKENPIFTFSNRKPDGSLSIRIVAAANSLVLGKLTFKAGEDIFGEIEIPNTTQGENVDKAKLVDKVFHYSNVTAGDRIQVGLSYSTKAASSKTYLDFVEVNAERRLIFESNQLEFSYIPEENDKIVAFELSGVTSNVVVWDVSEAVSARLVQTDFNGQQLSFKIRNDGRLRRFIAFNPEGSLLHPIIEGADDVGIVQNQNFHELSNIDYVIVSHPKFIEQANELAEFHRKNDNLSTIVVTPEQLYNEFSSGTPDVGAIRNFLRMLYDRAEGNEDLKPKYLLLFGDGSFANKDELENNSNYILSYQTEESLSPTGSRVADDYYGLLDEDEGGISGFIDIGIGRFPVQEIEQAEALLKKIYAYTNTDNMDSWRNTICFIGDDLDKGGDVTNHAKQADALAELVAEKYPSFDIEKIYLDAYKQEISANGERYPDANKAVNERMEQGALIVNYTGHGSEERLTHEYVISKNDINSWKNIKRLPVFVTATCEFSRFDEYNKTTAGEMVLLNPNGGGVAMFTTTRLVWPNENFILNSRFYECAFEKDKNNKRLRLGDIVRIAKNNAGTSDNKRSYVLLGDPALELLYPEYNVKTLTINGKPVELAEDTIKALENVSISGVVTDLNDSIFDDFNGELGVTVFDKSRVISTLGNYSMSQFEYTSRSNILYKGRASVSNGVFSLSFKMPKDISYYVDYGRISYYAQGNGIDAHGSFDKMKIGGINESVTPDELGPQISLFINDESFINGDITGTSPKILALMSDEHGINISGTGIGHDMKAYLDGDFSVPIVLNNYYKSEVDDYTKGSVVFPLFNLEPGKHSIVVKVWDTYNNSSETEIEFLVVDEKALVIEDLINYPNPFSEMTWFSFKHNMSQTDLDVTLRIFSMSGSLVHEIETQMNTSAYQSEPIVWECDSQYPVLNEGVFIYQLIVRTPNGLETLKTGKMIKIK